MKSLILLLLAFSSLPLVADDSILKDEMSNIQRMIGQNVIDDYLKDRSEQGIPGQAIRSLIGISDEDEKSCPEDEKKAPEIRYEVIFIAQGSTQTGNLTDLPDQYKYFWNPNYYFNKPDQKMEISALEETLGLNWGRFNPSSSAVDKNSIMNQQIFIETVLQGVKNAEVDDMALARQIGELINRHYSSDTDKMNLLSTLSSRLNDNYNDIRNPGANNSANNPGNLPVPDGDMTLKAILVPSLDPRMKNMGPVCNDISEAVAMIGEVILPGKDVLVLNSGTHLGVVIADGKSTHIIDGFQQLTGENDTILDRTRSSTNLRIAKVIDGKLREIAVADTQLGQALEQTFQSGKPLLKTGADINSIIGQFNRQKITSKKISNLGGAIGYGQLSESQVLVVVAKYSASGKKWDRNIGLGFSGQSLEVMDNNKYMLHFRGGGTRKIIHYVSPKVDFRLSSGIQTEMMYTVAGGPQDVLTRGPEASVSLDLIQRMQLSVTPDRKSYVGLSAELRNSLGPGNWGETTGALSSIEGKDIGQLLGAMRFHINQVNIKGIIEKKISANVTGTLQANYQGSNIGQNVNIMAGLKVKAPHGAELLYFVGHDSRLRGYETQNSLLVAPEGARVGLIYQHRNGIRASAAVRNINGEGKPIVEAGVIVPMDVTRKKKNEKK